MARAPGERGEGKGVTVERGRDGEDGVRFPGAIAGSAEDERDGEWMATRRRRGTLGGRTDHG